jgi:hypothetical protein
MVFALEAAIDKVVPFNTAVIWEVGNDRFVALEDVPERVPTNVFAVNAPRPGLYVRGVVTLSIRSAAVADVPAQKTRLYDVLLLSFAVAMVEALDAFPVKVPVKVQLPFWSILLNELSNTL